VELAQAVLGGSALAAARLISLLENRIDEAIPALRVLHGHTGRAHVVGVTGPPGAGKSSLVNALIRTLRNDGRRVGVVAIDPTSPFTGGAILGDRIRMQDHSTDPGVFVRSMATRGRLGGLAPATAGAVGVLDAYGCDVIFVETVGAGQAEVDIAGTADTVVLVTVPVLGDSVQMLKAGIMEIADVFVVNKADRGEADRTATEIKAMLGLAPDRTGWRPPVTSAVATQGRGVPEVLQAIGRHRVFLADSGTLLRRRQTRYRREIIEIVEERLLARAGGERVDQLALGVARGEMDPYSAADVLMTGGEVRDEPARTPRHRGSDAGER
jgi:LAO/AO transport system kinase